MTEADIDGLRAEVWTDPQIIATVHVTGIFACMNRVAEAFGLTPIPPPRSARAAGR
jgi:alkylhydroperoxidase family enzyme